MLLKADDFIANCESVGSVITSDENLFFRKKIYRITINLGTNSYSTRVIDLVYSSKEDRDRTFKQVFNCVIEDYNKEK